MARFSPYPRREYGRIFRAWARRDLKALALVGLGVIVLLAIETVLIVVLVPASSFRWWLLGALQAAIVAVGLHLTNAAFLAHEREAIWQLRGAWGEEATRDELRRAKKKRVVWGWVDSISLQAGDLDHLVLTCNGGFVAIDSKWRSDGRDTAAMAQSANRAKLRAEAVTRTLLKSERGGHRAKAHTAEVKPVVVIEVDGIEFVGGRRLLAWLQNLSGERVDKLAAKDALERLKTFRSQSWAASSARK